MSRSYRKTPCVRSDVHNTWREKRQANKVVRQSKDISNGSNFKKTYNSWNICDYKCYIYDKEEAKNKSDRYVRIYTNK